MGRFRETLWFKKGEEAPADRPSTGDMERPIEDRYEDDGSISLIDHVQFSVVTGTTQAIGRRALRLDAGEDAAATMRLVVGQMKKGRGRVYAMVGASVACLVFLAALLAV